MKSNNILKKFSIISCATIIAAAFAGCSTQAPAPLTAIENEPVASQVEIVPASEPTNAAESTTDNYIGEEQAKSIALSHAGVSEADVSHMFCKLDYDNGIAEYEVEFWDGNAEYDYEINALSGEIIGYDYDMESYDINASATINSGTNDSADYIGEAQAKAIALEHAGISESEAGFIKCEFEFDDGRAEYEVEWQIGRTEYDYIISATDGTILEHDVDYDD